MAVERFFDERLIGADPALEAALQSSAAAGLPAINVTPAQGRFLHLLARIRGARRILEVGTLGGYSTIWLARALPTGGELISLELNPDYAALARANVGRAGLADRVDIRVGSAASSLAHLGQNDPRPFDLVFIDADKPSTPLYFEWALRLTRPGAVVVIDNVVRDGAVADPATAEAGAQAMRRFADSLAGEKRVSATALQTVGSKGYDGFILALVVA